MMSRLVVPASVAVLLLGACDRSSRSAANDTAGSDGTLPDTVAAAGATNPGWPRGDGPILLVATSNTGEARAIAPNLIDADGAPLLLDLARPVTLLARDGRSILGRVTRMTPHDGEQCVAWPTASIVDATGSVPPSWTVGLMTDGATPLSMDSVEAFTRADSTRLASELARISSALKDDTAQSFRGLPFVVREMRRFRPEPGTEAVVADVARVLATEANPREERLFLIAERSGEGPWRPTYVTRTGGPEGAIETTEALVALKTADGRVEMVVALESTERSRFALLQRGATGVWQRRWTSAETDC